ncbi:MAG: HEAT repeat domain-containing protein [Planctomycetes bacterium]|nr:HEAT repeat domain-containing protein [Planctomycetota bacterium]
MKETTSQYQGCSVRTAGPRSDIRRRIPKLTPVLLGLACCLLAGVGCVNRIREHKHPVLLTRSDIDHYCVAALEGTSADERRKAVERLGKSKQNNTPQVSDTLAKVAANDSSPTVRSAAVIALDRTNSPRSCEVALALLQTDGTNPILAEEATIRLAALQTIQHCAIDDRVPLAELDPVVEAAKRFLEQDRSRHVRLESARVLGYFPRREVLDTLVNSLRQKDFGICYEAEVSLHRLTGESFDCDPVAWKKFLGGATNPFANAPEEQETQSTSKRSWFSRQQ